MNIGVTSCMSMAGIFFIVTVVFALLKEKGAILIGGFNTLSKQQRMQYDQVKMSKDMRNMFLIWTMVFGVGAILSYLISSYIAIVAFIVWLVLFFKEVHFDTEKAFGKYRL